MNAPKPNKSRMGESSSKQSDDIDDSEINEYKELSYKLFHHRDYKVRSPDGAFLCPFCACTEEGEYQYSHLLQPAVRVAEGSLSGKQKAKHYAMAKYLVFDLAHEAIAEADQFSRKRSRPGEDISKNKSGDGGARTLPKRLSKREKEALDRVSALECELEETRDRLNEMITKDRLGKDEMESVRTELIERIGELDPELFISEVRKKSHSSEVELKAMELCTIWEAKIKDPLWYPYTIVEDNLSVPKRIVRDDDVSLLALKEEWGKKIHDEVVKALTDLVEYNPSGCYAVSELWNFNEERKAKLGEVIRHIFQLLSAKSKPQALPQNHVSSKF